MRELIEKASVLHEALPYIRKFHGATFVVKYGGHAMVDEALRDGFARDVTLMKYVGLNPVVVHGGGPQIDAMLAAMGVVSERIDGLRVTDPRTMEVVEMVLGGKVNQAIVSLISKHGGRAVGLTGRDDAFLRARKVLEMRTKKGALVDPGRVGEIVSVRPDVVRALMAAGFIPVIAPVAVDENGESLNVNADTVAGHVAAALGAEKLVLMTDIEGVRGASGELVPSLTAGDIARMKDEGVISGGMIPKVQCALDALSTGVAKVHIIDGRMRHAALLEIFTDRGIGTEIVALGPRRAPPTGRRGPRDATARLRDSCQPRTSRQPYVAVASYVRWQVQRLCAEPSVPSQASSPLIVVRPSRSPAMIALLMSCPPSRHCLSEQGMKKSAGAEATTTILMCDESSARVSPRRNRRARRNVRRLGMAAASRGAPSSASWRRRMRSAASLVRRNMGISVCATRREALARHYSRAPSAIAPRKKRASPAPARRTGWPWCAIAG